MKLTAEFLQTEQMLKARQAQMQLAKEKEQNRLTALTITQNMAELSDSLK